MKGAFGRAKGEVRRQTLSESPHVLAAARGRRSWQPVVLERMGRPEYRVLSVEEMAGLRVDERYQRVRVSSMVNDLIHVLSEGGAVLDPITVAQRPDDQRFILDGQQRFWAHSELKRPLPALVYRVPGGDEGLEIERKAFHVLNQKAAVSGDHHVKAWHGPVGDLVRRWESKPDSPLYCRINFSSATRRSFPAGVLLRCLVAAMGGRSLGGILRLLPIADGLLAKPGHPARVEAVARTLAAIFPADVRMSYVAAMAIGEIAEQRWERATPAPPNEASTRALRRINWLTVAPTSSAKFLPLVRAEIDKRWRG